MFAGFYVAIGLDSVWLGVYALGVGFIRLGRCVVETEQAVDLEAHYRVAGFGGVAWYLRGYATERTAEEWVYCGEGDEDDESSYVYCEPEEVEDRSRVRAVMVGDDREFVFGVDELERIGEEDFCRGCGQIGCGCEVWS